MTIDAPIASIVISLITLIVAPVVIDVLARLRESNNREVTKKEAERLAAQLKLDNEVTAKALVADTSKLATDLAAKLVADAAGLAAKVGEAASTAKEAATASREAASEANTVNKKIAELGTQNMAINGVLMQLAKHLRSQGRPRRRARS